MKENRELKEQTGARFLQLTDTQRYLYGPTIGTRQG